MKALFIMDEMATLADVRRYFTHISWMADMGAADEEVEDEEPARRPTTSAMTLVLYREGNDRTNLFVCATGIRSSLKENLVLGNSWE